MAKIKDYLQDILKQIDKQNTDKEKTLQDLKEELKNFQEFNIEGYDLTTKREKDIKRAIKYLEAEQTRQELKNRYEEIKLEKQEEKILLKEVYNYFYEEFSDYFNNNNHKERIYNLAHTSEVIKDEIETCKKDLIIDSDINIVDTYFKALNDTYKIYKYDIEQEHKQEKTRIKEHNDSVRRINNFNKNMTMFNVGIIALSKLSKNYNINGYSRRR